MFSRLHFPLVADVGKEQYEYYAYDRRDALAYLTFLDYRTEDVEKNEPDGSLAASDTYVFEHHTDSCEGKYHSDKDISQGFFG